MERHLKKYVRDLGLLSHHLAKMGWVMRAIGIPDIGSYRRKAIGCLNVAHLVELRDQGISNEKVA